MQLEVAHSTLGDGRSALLCLENLNFTVSEIFLSSGKAGNPKTYDDVIRDYINEKILEKNRNLSSVATEAFEGRMKILGREMEPLCYAEQVVIKVRARAEEVGKKLIE